MMTVYKERLGAVPFQFTSFDEAVHMVQDLGQNCLLFKIDIRSAFRLLPVAAITIDWQVAFYVVDGRKFEL